MNEICVRCGHQMKLLGNLGCVAILRCPHCGAERPVSDPPELMDSPNERVVMAPVLNVPEYVTSYSLVAEGGYI